MSVFGDLIKKGKHENQENAQVSKFGSSIQLNVYLKSKDGVSIPIVSMGLVYSPTIGWYLW